MKKILFLSKYYSKKNRKTQQLFLKSVATLFCMILFTIQVEAQTVQINASCSTALNGCTPDPIDLTQNGTTTAGGVRNIYQSVDGIVDCTGGVSDAAYRVIWDNGSARWFIQATFGSPWFNGGTIHNLFQSTEATAPNPPNLATGNWTAVGGNPTNCGNSSLDQFDGTGTQAVSSNTAPTITIDNLQYTQGQNSGNPVQIDGSAAASDNEENWDGGSLTVQITNNQEPGDEISISQTGITISGTSIEEGGVTFASISETSGTVNDGIVTNGDELTINFNGNATNARVQALVRAIVYRSTANTPGTSTRTVTYILSDDTEGTTETPDISIILLPTITVAATTSTVTEDGATNLLFRFTRDQTSGSLVVNFSIEGTAQDGDYVVSGATSYNTANNTGTVTFAGGSATVDLTVSPTNESLIEGSETVVVKIENPTP